MLICRTSLLSGLSPQRNVSSDGLFLNIYSDVFVVYIIRKIRLLDAYNKRKDKRPLGVFMRFSDVLKTFLRLYRTSQGLLFRYLL